MMKGIATMGRPDFPQTAINIDGLGWRPTMVAAGRSTPWTMERCQRTYTLQTVNISKRKQASPEVCALVIFFSSLGVIC
jgi:hypothetical protein